jgi:hypothetical protein
MKIAFLHKALIFGGAERLILDIALSFSQHGHSSSFYTCQYDKNKTFDEYHSCADIQIIVKNNS